MVASIQKFVAILPFLVLSNAQVCPGICLYWGDSVLNAATEVTIGNMTSSCAYFDMENSGHNDSELCLQNADDAISAGCRCGIPSVCPGICHGKDHIMLNADTTVAVTRGVASCSNIDLEAKEIIDAKGCDEMAEKAEQAGCICGLPTNCTGICLVKGESMLNKDAKVTVNGKQAKCEELDAQATSLVGDKICANNAADVLGAGCKCGVPMDCPGICVNSGESLLTADMDVTVDGKTAPCSYFNSIADEVIDGEVCSEMSTKAAAAGCKCGVAIKCRGLCLNENEFLLNAEIDVAVGGLGGTCSFFDNRAKDIIDQELCIAESEKVLEAGCKCGTPTECHGICPSGLPLLNPDEQVVLDYVGSSCFDFNVASKKFIDPDLCQEYGKAARNAGCKCPGGDMEPDEDGHYHDSALHQSLIVSFVLLVASLNVW